MTDEEYIITHCVSACDVRDARKEIGVKNQVEYLRRRIVLASAAGYFAPGAFYFTSGGKIFLCDELVPIKKNIRSYRIIDIARMALNAQQNVHLTAFGVQPPASYPLQLSLFADVPPAILVKE